jgi:hypothetical protein
MDRLGVAWRARHLLDPSSRTSAYSPVLFGKYSGADDPTCGNHPCSRRRRTDRREAAVTDGSRVGFRMSTALPIPRDPRNPWMCPRSAANVLRVRHRMAPNRGIHGRQDSRAESAGTHEPPKAAGRGRARVPRAAIQRSDRGGVRWIGSSVRTVSRKTPSP